MSRAVVIGAGFGGLASAVRLRARGYEVVVVEANEQAGGRASVHTRDGHVFDAGPTVITAPSLLTELWASVGRDFRDDVELMPVDPFYRVIFPDGARFDYVGEEERLIAQIAAISPRDVDGYRRFAAHSRKLFDVGYRGLAATPFDRVTDMLRVAPDLVRLRSTQSVYSLVSSFIHDERLRQVFTFQPLLIGGSPFRAPGLYAMIHWLEREEGVWFPRGGTGAIVRALVGLLDELGVPVRTSTPVEEIEVVDGRAVAVRVRGGERIAADVVVSNGDPSIVYEKLIAPVHRRKHSDRSLARVRPSMSLFVSYFGTDVQYEDVAHHTILLGPRYRGLLHDIFVKHRLAEDFSLYLHRPTASDPSLAPSGRETFYVLSPVPNLRGATDWENEAPRYQERIHRAIEERLMPGLAAHVTTSFFADPRTFRDRYRSAHGAAFGPEPQLTQSAWFRFHNRSEDVAGLFFVGAGTHPGAGVPGVLTSAKVLDQVVAAPREPVPLPVRRGRRAA